MLKKILKISLFWAVLFSLNTSAESVKKFYINDTEIGIEDHNERVYIRVESPTKGMRVITEPSIEQFNLGERKKKVLEQSRARYPEDIECKWLHDCRKICKDIYHSRYNRLFCGEFPKTQVEKIYAMYNKHLHPFREQNLTDETIDSLDLEVLVTIDSDRLESRIKGFSPSEKRNFLVWMARDGKVVDSFQEADNGDLSEELLKDIEVEGAGLGEVFTKNIYDGKSFIELALDFTESGDVSHMNVLAFYWMETVFQNRCYDREGFDNSWEELTLCAFTEGFCQMGLTEAQWKALLTPQQHFVFVVLHSTVSTIVKNFTTDTPPEWWINGVEPRKLGAAEMNALCEMDLVKKDK